MIGIIGAAGNDHADTPEKIEPCNVGGGFWYLGLGGVSSSGGSLTGLDIIDHPPSDGRHMLIAIIVHDDSANGLTVTDLTINGETVNDFTAATVNFNAATQSMAVAVGYKSIPLGTKFDWSFTLGSTVASLSGNILFAIYDIGTNDIGVTTGTDNTAGTSQELNPGDLGLKCGCLAVYGFEDSASNSSTSSVSSSGRTVEYSFNNNQGSWLFGGAIVNGDPGAAFPFSVQPNNGSATDEGILAYITAHYH